MKVLGIDLGLARCGVAVVERSDEKGYSLLGSWLLTTDKEMSFAGRAMDIWAEIEKILGEYMPWRVVMESFHSLKSRSQKDLIKLEGYLEVCLKPKPSKDLTRFFPVDIMPPSKVKRLVTGKGNADKKLVREHVEHYLGLSERYAGRKFSADEVDAMAACLAVFAEKEEV